MSTPTTTTPMTLSPFMGKPREITTIVKAENPSYGRFWNYFMDFWKYRSFRRIYIFTGGAGVLLAAWYLYNKYTENQQDQEQTLPPPAACIPSTNSVKGRVSECNSNVSTCNNNATKRSKNTTGNLQDPNQENKVVVHCCPRGYFVPSIATEPLKLETFLRVANIPYEVTFCNEYEAPLLTYGDKIGNDFRESIRILSDGFDVNLEGKDTSASRKTASNLVDISLENHFAWGILIWRWIYDEGKSMNQIQAINALGDEVVPEVALRVKEAIRFHPIGQMDKTEFEKAISQGIHDLSAALGRHTFFQGQEPGAVDCHAFAILSQILWNMPGSPFAALLKKYGNLVDFWKRMKEKYWPDWNELILKPDEFQESYNAIVKHHYKAPPTTQIKKASVTASREHADSSRPADKTATEVRVAKDEENGTTKSRIPEPTHTVSPVGNPLPDPEAVTVITKTEEHAADPNQSILPSQPMGILKAGAVSPSTNGNVAKSRSGLVTASIGSTKFPVEEINKISRPAMPNNEDLNTGLQQPQNLQPITVQPQKQNILCPPPMQPPQQKMQIPPRESLKLPNMICLPPAQPVKQPNSLCPTPQEVHVQNSHIVTSLPPQNHTILKRDSMTHVHKPSVKFANVSSVDSSVFHTHHHQANQTQYPTKTSNGNFHPNNVPQSLLKDKSQYPGSVGELSKRRSPEREVPEHARHSMIHRGQLPNYPHALPRHSMEPTVLDEFHRAHLNNAAQYYTLPPPNIAYGHHAYSVAPVLYSTPPIPATLPPPVYSQGIHYPPPSPSTYLSGNDGLDHSPLNPEQMQKAVQAHLDAHFLRQKQYQRQQEAPQYPNNYHTPAGILPGFVAPPFDPRNPTATLLRF